MIRLLSKLNFSIFILVLLAGLFLISQKADAAVIVTTPAENDTAEFVIPDSALRSWQGNFRLQDKSSAEATNTSVKDLVSTAISGKLETKATSTVRYKHNPTLVYEWLKTAKSAIQSNPIEPKLEIKNGRAVHFVPPQVGQELDMRKSAMQILAALEKNQTEAILATREVNPKEELSSTNNIGINELIGRGTSNFAGSPRNRRTNIRVGVEKMQGVIIKPGEEFSFNKYLGPVEKEYGFVPELVIKGNDTIPELGGGLCQVSSTTFRAAMDAGLPITQRKNHSYAVQYYAKPWGHGADATIYPGVIDLKFKNDTPGNILVWPYFRTEDDLIFDFYGTRDDREVTLEQPVQWDRKANGALKASWTRIVKKDGQESKDVFQSNYLPPALFHKEETFVANPENPNGTPSQGLQPGTTPYVGSPIETPSEPIKNPPQTESPDDSPSTTETPT